MKNFIAANGSRTWNFLGIVYDFESTLPFHFWSSQQNSNHFRRLRHTFIWRTYLCGHNDIGHLWGVLRRSTIISLLKSPFLVMKINYKWGIWVTPASLKQWFYAKKWSKSNNFGLYVFVRLQTLTADHNLNFDEFYFLTPLRTLCPVDQSEINLF